MAFFNSAIGVLQTLVVALGAGLGVWGAINLLEGYGNDNPALALLSCANIPTHPAFCHFNLKCAEPPKDYFLSFDQCLSDYLKNIINRLVRCLWIIAQLV